MKRLSCAEHLLRLSCYLTCFRLPILHVDEWNDKHVAEAGDKQSFHCHVIAEMDD